MSLGPVSVVGLGYVGLPLALEFAKAGLKVFGIEQNPDKVEKVNRGESYIEDVDSKELKGAVLSGGLTAFTEFYPVKDSNSIVICVPTPLTLHKEPDISYIVNVTNEISKFLKRGQLVILESTTYPGTTEEVVLPILEKSGLKAGVDFYLAFSPERVDPGNKKFTTKDIPKVVGGINQESTELAGKLYSHITDKVCPVSSPKVAEMTKLLENIFRLVNISFVNELALLCQRMDIDIWEVISGASTKPYGFMPFYPGPGLGGHCIIGEEMVLVKNCDRSYVLSLKELFEKETKDNDVFRFGDLEYISPENLFINSIDPSIREQSLKPITHLFKRNYSGKLIKITMNDNRTLTVTDKHPMLKIVGDRLEAVEAEDLKIGDILPVSDTASISSAEVKKIEIEEGNNVPVYSLEVADTHTFAVGKGVYVHNCIPIDPFYLSWKAKEYDFDVRFIELAGEINDNMPKYIVQLVMEGLNKDKKAVNGSKILVIGIAYKPNIADPRESPALKIIPELERLGGEVEYYDPYIKEIKIGEKLYKSCSFSEEKVKDSDCTLIITDHDNIDYSLIFKNAKRIVDTRNALRRRGIEIDKRVERL